MANSSVAGPVSPATTTGPEEFVDAVNSLSMDLFEDASVRPSDREIAVSLTPRYSTFKKLEVVPARRINTMAGIFNVTTIAALLASSTVVLLARFTYSSYFEDIPSLQPGKLISLTVYNFPRAFTLVDSICSFILFAVSLVIISLFCFVLIRQGKQVLNEQVWVLMLLLGTVLYLNPYEASVRLRRDYLGLDIPNGEGFSYLDVFTCLRMVSFSVISILYIWMGSHSYRYLTRRISFKDWRFYAPKVLVVLVYNIYKLSIFFRYRITFSELPFATLVGFLTLYKTLGVWPGLGVATVCTLTAMEILILSFVFADLFRTSWVLNNCEYVEHRTKIIGFRFFLHQQLIFYGVYTATYILLLFGLPNGLQVLEYVIRFHGGATDGKGSYFDVQYAPVGLHLCILAYVATEAYTNLPASASMASLFMRTDDSVEEAEILEPVVYRNREPRSFAGTEPDFRPNCFIMQTNIELFNLAWFVYYKGTSKENKLDVDFSTLTLKVEDSFYSKETDTRGLIAASSDRIIVAFKGTSSSQNLYTDIKVIYRSLSQAISRHLDESEEYPDDSRAAAVVPIKVFKRAKIHAGFVDAYNSVKHGLIRTLEVLISEKKRPIFFTGHSLGGALATISSLDVSLSLDIPSKHIVVTTFGSPRVGNRHFQQIYDEVVTTHWRVVAGGDLVSRLPKLGYHHVGRKVILTAGGQLFIDPNALDMLFWDSQPASLVHHRKSCYLLALKSWCDSRDSDYVPNFWPFPISEHDSRKFDTAFRKPNSQKRLSITPRHTQASMRARKYQKWVDAIDILDSPIQNQHALQSWTKLGAAVLCEMRQGPPDVYSAFPCASKPGS